MNEMSWGKQKIGLINMQQLHFKSSERHSYSVPYPSCNVKTERLQGLQITHATYVILPGSDPHVLGGQSPFQKRAEIQTSQDLLCHQPSSDITSLLSGTVWVAQCKEWDWIPVQPRAGAHSCFCQAL